MVESWVSILGTAKYGIWYTSKTSSIMDMASDSTAFMYAGASPDACSVLPSAVDGTVAFAAASPSTTAAAEAGCAFPGSVVVVPVLSSAFFSVAAGVSFSKARLSRLGILHTGSNNPVGVIQGFYVEIYKGVDKRSYKVLRAL